MEIDSANEGIIIELVLTQIDIKELHNGKDIICVEDLGWPPIKGKKIMIRVSYESGDDE